jgi:uncharacterized protein YciI
MAATQTLDSHSDHERSGEEGLMRIRQTGRTTLVWFLFAVSTVFSVGGEQPLSTQHVYVALYERGPAWVEGESVRQLPVFQQHVAHIKSISARLLGAGPFMARPGESMIGMVLLRASSDEDARKLAESDPFVQARYTRVSKVLRWEVDKLKPFSQ